MVIASFAYVAISLHSYLQHYISNYYQLLIYRLLNSIHLRVHGTAIDIFSLSIYFQFNSFVKASTHCSFPVELGIECAHLSYLIMLRKTCTLHPSS